MKKTTLTICAALCALFLSINAKAQTPAAMPTAGSTRQVAAAGEKVWVIINHVKADKRQQFEKFIEEVFWPMAQKLKPEDQRLFRHTRVLYPTQAETDGTYSYFFVMDPILEGGDYEIDRLLKQMYSEEKAAEYGRMFGESLAGDQTQYIVVQSRN